MILFSDVPTDESAQVNIPNTNAGHHQNYEGMDGQSLLLRICDSEWSNLPFDLTKLQSEPIQIKDKLRKEGQP